MTTETSSENTLPGFQPSFDEPSGTGYESPLKEFEGTGAGYEVKGGTNKNGRAWQRIVFKFIDVNPILTEEPYPHPSAEISIFYSEPTKEFKRTRDDQGISDWAALSDSVRAIYKTTTTVEEELKQRVASFLNECFGGQVVNEGDMPAGQGKRMRWKKIPTMLNVGPNESNAKWHDELKDAWKVVEIEGVGSISTDSANGTSGGTGGVFNILDHLATMADGKLEKAFYEEALDDPEVMKQPGIINSLNDRSFVQQMKDLGKVTQDADTTLHKIG